MNGALEGMDQWGLIRQIGNLISEHPELRAFVYDQLKSNPASPRVVLLARRYDEQRCTLSGSNRYNSRHIRRARNRSTAS
jgi:hypothetical protein